jgi:hypothetical protein
MTITAEQKRAIDQSGDEPVRVEDPETHATYVLVKEETYRKLRGAVQVETIDPSFYEFGEFIPLKK